MAVFSQYTTNKKTIYCRDNDSIVIIKGGFNPTFSDDDLWKLFMATSKNCFASDLWIFLETYQGASLQCIAGYAIEKEI